MGLIDDLRQYRIFNLALFDLAFGFVGAFIIHLLLWMYPLEMKNKEKRTTLQYLGSLLLIFVMVVGLGVIVHRLVGVKSALSAHLGFNDPIR